MILLSSMSEKLANAGVNSLICIAVVFIVLIFISLVISLFGFIPKAEAAIAAKKEAKKANKNEIKDVSEDSIDNTISQITAKEEEELVDDLELIAVIAAAIAASTGTSTDDFVVRSIRKVRRK